jgi:tRNA nucleotidyltransferase/poly(A) polymerase
MADNVLVRKKAQNTVVCNLQRRKQRTSKTKARKPQLPQIPQAVADVLVQLGLEKCWLFGGTVRDSMLGRTNGDCDFITSVGPEQLRETYKNNLLGKESSQTAELTSADGSLVHIAPFHRGMETIEQELKEGRRGSISIDVMAFSLGAGDFIDPCRGYEDFISGIVRVTDPSELEYNPQLAFRAFRLAVNYGFGIEQGTYRTICDSFETYSTAIDQMKERWRIVRMVAQGLGSLSPSESIEWWRASGIMKLVLPELYYLSENHQEKYDGALLACEKAPLPKRLPVLLEFLGSKEREAIIRRFEDYLSAPHRIRETDLCAVSFLNTL